MDLVKVAAIAFVPVLASLFGGITAAFKRPGPAAQSLIQHFTAGVVLAGLAGEVIPEIEKRSASAALIGFLIGLPLVILIRLFGERLEGRGDNSGLILALGADLILDGLPVGIGFVIGGKIGLVLTLVVSLELYFLGLSVAGGLKKATTAKKIELTFGLGLLFWLSAIFGAAVFSRTSDNIQTVALAVGAIVFLYLAADELLKEAHKVKETSLSTAIFFSGFILLLFIELVA